MMIKRIEYVNTHNEFTATKIRTIVHKKIPYSYIQFNEIEQKFNTIIKLVKKTWNGNINYEINKECILTVYSDFVSVNIMINNINFKLLYYRTKYDNLFSFTIEIYGNISTEELCSNINYIININNDVDKIFIKNKEFYFNKIVKNLYLTIYEIINKNKI